MKFISTLKYVIGFMIPTYVRLKTPPLDEVQQLHYSNLSIVSIMDAQYVRTSQNCTYKHWAK
jgi:hypothetical protein